MVGAPGSGGGLGRFDFGELGAVVLLLPQENLQREDLNALDRAKAFKQASLVLKMFLP